MPRNSELNKLRAVFAGCENGHFTLPDNVLRLHARLEPITNALRAQWADQLPGATGAYEAALLDAMDKGKPLPDPAPLAKADAADRASAVARRVIADVLDQAQDNVVNVVVGTAEEIAVEHLRPALADTIEAATVAVKALNGHPLDAEAALLAPEATREAILALGPLARRYQAIRQAQRVLLTTMTPGPKVDVDGAFFEFRNLPKLWPNYSSWTRRDAPWPTEGRARLAWIVTSEAEPWLPLSHEQDRALIEWFPDSPAARAARGEGIYHQGLQEVGA